MKLITPTEYIHEASKLARTATSRIYLLSAVVADHPNTHELIHELETAAMRGVEVVVAADVFTFGAVIEDYLPVRYRTTETRQAQRMARALRKAGVTFHWLGNKRATLFSGRTHTKWCVIDDTVFSFGGVNMYEKGVSNVDYMLMLKDKNLADRLVHEQEKIQVAEEKVLNYPSESYMLDSKSTVLIDGGMVGRSIIYKRACELAKQSTHITFVSQYCPTSKLSRLIKQRSSATYFNKPGHAKSLNSLPLGISIAISGHKSLYTRQNYLHAKLIIFTLTDGTKVAISGSHNFAYTGVLLGTREVALETSNKKIIAQLEKFVKNEVARVND